MERIEAPTPAAALTPLVGFYTAWTHIGDRGSVVRVKPSTDRWTIFRRKHGWTVVTVGRKNRPYGKSAEALIVARWKGDRRGAADHEPKPARSWFTER